MVEGSGVGCQGCSSGFADSEFRVVEILEVGTGRVLSLRVCCDVCVF